MSWANIKLIYWREMVDQTRDRRTIFTIALIPLMLYPLMGIALLQLGQLMRPSAPRVWLVNIDCLPTDLPLLDAGHFSRQLGEDLELPQVCLDPFVGREPGLIDGGSAAENLFCDWSLPKDDPRQLNPWIKAQMSHRQVDAIVYFQSVGEDPSGLAMQGADVRIKPGVKVSLFYDSTDANSRLAAEQTRGVLVRWQRLIAETRLRARQITLPEIDSLQLSHQDVAESGRVEGAVWSRILPFVIAIWALMGAFYPAVDLCAGEKERGTFETLLSSPADRGEIAIGKWLTVLSFSYLTASLNLLSMSLTGMLVTAKLLDGAGFESGLSGLPSFSGFVWLLVGLIPIAAFFSAISLAVAAFARSSKEGQYYLLPLMMISLPLMMIPLLPSARLEWVTSLIPVAGLIMLLRHLLEGEFHAVLSWMVPVAAVNLGICWLSIRWVIRQFQSEVILFSGGDQISLLHWFKLQGRLRRPRHSAGTALLCAWVILICQFFSGRLMEPASSFFGFAVQTLILTGFAVGLPVLALALILAPKPWQSFRFNGCRVSVACAAVLLAIFLNPLTSWLDGWMSLLCFSGQQRPIPGGLTDSIFRQAPGWWAVLLVIAIVPAVIEEIGFRGFILSGLESLRSKWGAILLSSLFFGLAQTTIQQSPVGFFIGMILGVIALQTRSIVPCILFHAVHNCIVLLLSQTSPQVVKASPWFNGILEGTEAGGFQFGPFAGVSMTVLAIALLVWIVKFPTPAEPVGLKSAFIPAPVAHWG